MSFENKTVLITGGTSGIGRASAERFAAAGAEVVISGRDEARGVRGRKEPLCRRRAFNARCSAAPCAGGRRGGRTGQ